jgi:hypothetical protein
VNCFYHPSVSAVALCKNCFKGLCPDCAADVGDGLACVGRCEERVRLCNRATQRGVAALSDTNSQYRWAAIFGVAALLFLGFGAMTVRSGGLFLLGVGLFLGALAASMYYTGRRMRRAVA